MHDIDPELSRLIRDAADKLDALESPEHQAQVAKLRDLDNERVAVAEAVQSRIIAAMNAQNAVLAYRCSMSPEPAPFDDTDFSELLRPEEADLQPETA